MSDHTNRKNAAPTSAEYYQARGRILVDSFNRLAIGPTQAFSVGCATVFGLSCLEGSLHLAKSPPGTTPPPHVRWQRGKFVVRYGLANMIPSLIWGRIEAVTVAKALDLSVELLLQQPPLSPRTIWRRKRLQSLRGGIAGTVLIAQLVQFGTTTTNANDAYRSRLQLGSEPPMHDPSQRETALRMAGQISDATMLGMRRDGRRKYFPIYEVPEMSEVKTLVKTYGMAVRPYGVPVFWHVQDGQYGKEDSWKNLVIPKYWLFDKKKQQRSTSPKKGAAPNHDKLLILEADATTGESMSFSFQRPKQVEDLDLNLYESAQAFYHLRRQVAKDAPPHDVLRVLLADADAIVTSGGGHLESVREYVESRGLADVVIDAQSPLLHVVQTWLQLYAEKQETQSTFNRPNLLKKRKQVVLETPDSSCYTSIRKVLRTEGYDVVEMADVKLQTGGNVIRDLPILVYERTTQDTIHTIRRLVQEKVVLPEDVCALCPTHHGLVERGSGEVHLVQQNSVVGVTAICTSDVYDQLFRDVRRLAKEGYSAPEIQESLDGGGIRMPLSKLRLSFPSLS